MISLRLPSIVRWEENVTPEKACIRRPFSRLHKEEGAVLLWTVGDQVRLKLRPIIGEEDETKH
jgi:hypothetical protein